MNMTTTKDLTFGFYINLNERGSFYGDLRNMDGTTVLEIKSNDDGEIDLIEDGYLKHNQDLAGIAEYAVTVGLIPAGASVLSSNDFEQFEQDWAEAIGVLSEFEPSATAAELYEDNDDLADALDDLLPDFKLKEHGSLTIAAIIEQLTAQPEPAAKKSAGMRMG